MVENYNNASHPPPPAPPARLERNSIHVSPTERRGATTRRSEEGRSPPSCVARSSTIRRRRDASAGHRRGELNNQHCGCWELGGRSNGGKHDDDDEEVDVASPVVIDDDDGQGGRQLGMRRGGWHDDRYDARGGVGGERDRRGDGRDDSTRSRTSPSTPWNAWKLCVASARLRRRHRRGGGGHDDDYDDSV